MIAQEAGGFVTGSRDAAHDGVVTEAILTGRRYLVVRSVPATPVRADRAYRSNITSYFPLYTFVPHIHPFTQEESSLEVQKRIAREFYDTVEDIPLDE